MVGAVAGVGFFGALLGSFLNVVIWRLPRGESLVRPRSACPGCGTPVRPRDNAPVISWLLLRGRCRDCGTSISRRYPAVELLTAALLAAVALADWGEDRMLLGLVLMLALVPITFIDLDHRIIPNKITAPTAVAGVALLAVLDPGALPEHLIAAALAGGFLLIALLAYPSGMGMGDVKLAAVLGLFLGREVAPALLIGLLAGTFFGVAVMARKGVAKGRKTAVPFGPFLALGGVAGWFVGAAIVEWYLDTFL
jgi:leader peptidase (prepilin peptidase) / N-methyltransferase